jgi:hypothetical protein|tara:strand:+ start:757 stop:909 length:153 start_codon:yes stop_codon:yes gene_type:complete
MKATPDGGLSDSDSLGASRFEDLDAPKSATWNKANAAKHNANKERLKREA